MGASWAAVTLAAATTAAAAVRAGVVVVVDVVVADAETGVVVGMGVALLVAVVDVVAMQGR
ncbi:MAG: hypothetical protein M9929_05795 [Burkholderiaceae bacterium]|nr:hypothetical protein [Burkholderiaceae bacterium]